MAKKTHKDKNIMEEEKTELEKRREAEAMTCEASSGDGEVPVHISRKEKSPDSPKNADNAPEAPEPAVSEEAEAAAVSGEPEDSGAAQQETSPEEPDMAAQIESLTEERDMLKDQMLRLRAEFENFRKRQIRMTEQIRKTATESLVRDLFPVLDHLDLALQHAGDESGSLAEGVAMVLKQFRDVLAQYGLKEIPAEGLPFDPTVHEALMQREEPGKEPNMVVEVFQKGYQMDDLILRPAKVVVSAASTNSEADEQQSAEAEKDKK